MYFQCSVPYDLLNFMFVKIGEYDLMYIPVVFVNSDTVRYIFQLQVAVLRV